MKSLLTLLLLCAPAVTLQETAPKPPPKEKATVYFYRGNFHVTFGKIAPMVYVGKTKVAALDEGRFFAVKLDEGEYVLRTDSKKGGTLTLDLVAGRTYFVRMDVKSGWFRPSSKLIRISSEEAREEIKKYSPIKDGDVRDSGFEVVKTLP